MVEAKGVFAIQRFSLLQLKRNLISPDRVPSAFVRIRLLRGDGTVTPAQRTVVRRNTSTPLYESLFYFNDIHVAEGELATCVLQLSVYDRGRLGPHMLVGSIDMDLESVYQLPNHELWRKWVTVLDPRGKRDGPQGQLKLCVAVLAKGDKPPDHGGEVADEGDGDGGELGDIGDLGGLDLSALGGPAAKTESTVPYALRLQAYAAMDLPRMDWTPGSGVQPYIQLSAGSKAARTRRRRGDHPQWRQELALTLQLPADGSGAPPIRITLFDQNLTTSDTPIAALRFSYAELRQHLDYYRRPRWYPLYGAPREPEGEFHLRSGAKLARRMNNGFVLGSDYRGSLLLSIEAAAERDLGPHKRRGLPMPDVKAPVNLVLLSEVLQLDLVLPEYHGRGSEVCVEVSYGLSAVRTVMWYEANVVRDTAGDMFVTLGEKLKPTNAPVPPPLEGDDAGRSAPDVFINIWYSSPMVKKQRIAFGRVPVEALLPAVETDYPEEAPEATTGGSCAFQGWITLNYDALSMRKGSSTVRSARPVGAVLVRLQMTRKPGGAVYILGITDKEEQEKRAAEEKRVAKEAAKEAGEESDSEDEDEAAAKANGKGPGLFEAGGRFGPDADPEVVQAIQTRPYRLRVYVYQAQGLPVADADGGSDPYCVVRCGNTVSRTQVCGNTTSPAWFAELPMDVLFPICSRPDLLSFGAMVHNAKHVDRARRQLVQSLFKKQLAERAALPPTGAREDLAPLADPEATVGGGLIIDGFQDAYTSAAGATRVPGASGAMGKGAVDSDDDENDDDEYADGDVLAWAVPRVNITVFDKSLLGDEPLCCVSIPTGRLWGRKSSGGVDADGQIFRSLPLQWYKLRTFEFKGARMNQPVDGSGGQILVALSVEGPMDSLRAVLDRDAFARSEAIKPLPGRSTYAPPCAPILARHAGDGAVNIHGITNMPSQPAELEVLVLGVRMMKPMLGLPVVSPSVEFELTGVLPLVNGQTVVRSKNSGRPTGTNANFKGELLALQGAFPTEEKCTPGLTIRVRDKRLGANVIVGIASLTPIPSHNGPGPSAAELEAENDAWAFMRKGDDDASTAKTPSMRSGLSALSGTDDGKGHKRARGAPAGDEQVHDDGGFDPHGMGETPPYLKGRKVLAYGMEDVLGHPPFFTVPVMRAGGGLAGPGGHDKGGLDDVVEVGLVKFCLRRVPLVPASIPGRLTKKDAEEQGLYTRMDHMSTDPPLDPLRDQVAGTPEKFIVRVYILRGLELRPTNSNGLSNPYIVATLGTKSVGNRTEAVKDTLYPPFYRMLEFKPALPGPGQLVVKVFNANDSVLPGATDHFIGETLIDLEDRWFSEEWRKYASKPPLERRTLSLRRGGGAQGRLELFVEILDSANSGTAPLNITPPPPEQVELRLVIWQAKHMENKKVILAQNDLFFRALVQGTDRLGRPVLLDKSTDIHWFSSGGTGSFNYRLIFRFELPLANPKLKISAWNKDIVGTTDDTIGEVTLSLGDMCGRLMKQLKANRAAGDKKDLVEILEPLPDAVNQGKMWLKVYHPSAKKTSKGEVEVQYALLTSKKADSRPVGEGQDEPNRDPVLPKADRATLDLLNPFGSLMTIIGPERLRQILFVLVLILVLLGTGGIGLVVANDFLSAEIMKKLGACACGARVVFCPCAVADPSPGAPSPQASARAEQRRGTRPRFRRFHIEDTHTHTPSQPVSQLSEKACAWSLLLIARAAASCLCASCAASGLYRVAMLPSTRRRSCTALPASSNSRHCCCCCSSASTSTSAAIASTMGTARGTTHGSWRPRARSSVSWPARVTVFWVCDTVLVGLKATRNTMFSPLLMPPWMPPLRLLRVRNSPASSM